MNPYNSLQPLDQPAPRLRPSRSSRAGMRASLRAFLRILIVIGLLAQPILIPLKLLASTTSASTTLTRGVHEDVDAYLQRIATAQPELFQQAALAAVQDAFNGRVPEKAGEKAMEEQIAFYLQQAASADTFTTLAAPSTAGLPPFSGAAQSTSSSLEKDGTYHWNAAQEDENGLAGSAWQLTAQPRGNSQVFAQNFEAMMAKEFVPALSSAGSPSAQTAAKAPTAGTALDTAGTFWQRPSPLLPVQASTAADTAPPQLIGPTAPTLSSIGRFAPLNRQDSSSEVADIHPAAQKETRPRQRSHTAASTVLAVAQALEADLGVTMTAPSEINFDEVMTYTLVVTNYGPSPATAVQLTQTLPANGIYTGSVPSCTGQSDTVVCTIGALAANEGKTFDIAVQMKGNDAVTSTVVVADSGGTIDPGGQPNAAQASSVISASTRLQREVGKIVIAANEFMTVAGKIEATGAVEIGFKQPDNSVVFHLSMGANNSVSWMDGAETLNGEGALSQKVRNFKLFEGPFSADGSQDAPLIIPGSTITPEITSLGGFALTGTVAITQVSVMSGTASVSATIKLSQPGVVSSTEQSLVAMLYSDGKIEGTIKQFAMVFSGLKIEVNEATVATDGIGIKQAKLTLPDKLGKLTGIINEMKVTTNSISFGGAGVKIPIPDLYPVGGAPVTSTETTTATTTVTPTVAIVKNAATVNYADGKLGLQIEGTLQLWLPSNHTNIPIKTKIDSDGKLTGEIDELNLTVAGQDLMMKNVAISGDGLKVKEATLTIKGSDNKDKKTNSTTGSGLAGNKANFSLASAAEAEKEPSKKLTLIVKDVVIDGQGLKIGNAGAAAELPDIKIGKSATFTKLTFTLVVNDPQGEASLEMSIKGVLKIHLKDNEQEVEFSAKRDKDGKFSGKIDKLNLTLAKSKLEISEMEFDDKGFSASKAELTLPQSLKGIKATVTRVKIDEKGLSFGDASVAIPVKFTLGKEGASNQIAVDGNLTLVLAEDRTYGFAIEGKVTIKVASQTAEAAGKFRMDSSGKLSGEVESFKLVVAGMELSLQSAKIKDGVLEAAKASFSVPKAWGGLSIEVTEVKVSDDTFSIGGGSFKLPEISVGDMKLALEGTLEKGEGGYTIRAGGLLKIPNVSGSGCSGLGVSIEIFNSTSNSTSNVVVMRVKPLTAEAANELKLRQIIVSLKCNISLGTSGFDLTSVTGTFTLTDNSTKIEMKAVIESKLKVGSFNAVTANGDMSVEYVKNPYKLEIGVGASMKIFSMFEAANARATMRLSDGDVPFLFKAEMNIDAVIAKGQAKLTAWTKDGRFHLTGGIYGQVGVRKGALAQPCVTISIPVGISWSGIRYKQVSVCLSLPPSDLFINATMEFGEFKKNNGSEWGFKAGVNFLGVNYGVYVDENARFRVGNVDNYKLIDAPTLQRALQLQKTVASGFRARSTLSAEEMSLLNDYHFDGQQITIDVADLAQVTDLAISVMRADDDADVQVFLKRPDGLIVSGINPPSNVTFKEEPLPLEQMTDITTGQPITSAPPFRQTALNVTHAELGHWQVILSHQPKRPFFVNVAGTAYGPPVDKLTLAAQTNLDNKVDLSWTQSAVTNTAVTIYASQGPITTTTTLSNSQFITGTNKGAAAQANVAVVTQFGGVPVSAFSYPAGAQNRTEKVDLSFLRSGTYNLWIEVDDGRNAPARLYFPGTVTVWHPWEENWQSNLTVQPTQGGLTVAWDENANADVDGYEIQVTALGENSADADTYRVDVGEDLSQTVTGVTANQPYSITVIAYDTGTGRTSTSESVKATPLNAPFTFTANPTALIVNGGSAATVTLSVTSAVMPYPDDVFLDVVSAPDGIDAELSAEMITPTVAGTQASLVITPEATLLGGFYTVTLSAATNGDVKQIQIPIIVQEPNFSLQASNTALTLPKGGSVSVDISAAYQFGESDLIDLDLDEVPAGVDWDFVQTGFGPGQKATLLLTATDYLDFGTYPIVIKGTDYEHEHTVAISLTAGGFALASPWDSWATQAGTPVTYPVQLTGASWPAPVNLSIDPASLGSYFVAQVPTPANVPAGLPAGLSVQVKALPGTPPGIYELELRAVSNGLTETLPLYLTVQDDANATDLQGRYQSASADDGVDDETGIAIAGEVYTYTVKPRNISANPGPNVVITDTTLGEAYLTLVQNGGCTVQSQTGETELVCAAGTIPAMTEGLGPIVSWKVAANAPDGTALLHTAEVAAQPGLYTETSDLDNGAELEMTVARRSDLHLEAQASPAVAGESMTFSTTVHNDGPSDADTVLIDIYLPEGVDLESASAGCVQDAELVTCAVGPSAGPLSGTLASATQATITATVRIAPDVLADLETLIVASSDSDDPDFTNNYSYVESEISTTAQLNVQITPSRVEATEGDTVDFMITATNQGPSQATDVGIELSVPANADITDIQLGDVAASLDDLTIEPGETLTMTVSILFMEDSNGQPVQIGITADSTQSAPILSNSPAVTLRNAAPTAELSGTLTVNEGELGTLTVHADDVGNDGDAEYDPLTIQWDLDNDGAFDDGNAGIVLFDARNIDGPATRPIAVRVRDDDGGETVVTGTVTIKNVAPTVDAGDDQYHPYSQTFVLNVTFNDPAISDTHILKVNWGDGKVERIPAFASLTGFDASRVASPVSITTQRQASHTYNRIGEFTADVCVEDKNGGVQCDPVLLEAACQEHGLIASVSTTGSQVVITLENASGHVVIPAGLPITLYSGDKALQTFKLATPMAVGESRPLHYIAAGALEPSTLQVVLDDNGSGLKTTQLCSGAKQFLSIYRTYLPLLANRYGPPKMYMPLISME